MARKLGTPQPKLKKATMGLTLTSFVLALIILPIILFSSLNPYDKIDAATGGKLHMDL